MLPNNKVHENYNGRCSETELFATSGGQIWPINKAVNPTTSSSEWRQEQLGGRENPSPWSIAQLEIQKEACGGEWRKTHFLSHEEKEKWIEDYVERETAGARKRVEDTFAAVQQEQDDMTHAEIAGFMSREPEMTCEKMLVAIRDSLSDLASSDDVEDGEDDEDEETVQGYLSDDDEPGWVMGTITKTVQQRMEMFRQKQMKLYELTQLGWEDAADYFCERGKKYRNTNLWVPAVVQPQTNDDTPAPSPAIYGELMESLDIVPGISQRPPATSQPGSRHIRLG
jgi:hypothetical protein